MGNVTWSCRCGRVKGRVSELAPDTANHCICYCKDCRAFMHWLGREDLLDAHGGVDIVQIAPARFAIDDGRDQLRCLRLTRRGMHRWYTECCKTPVANTVPPAPFVGISAASLGPEARGLLPDPDLIHGKSAVGGMPAGASSALSFRAVARPGKLFATWLARGLGHPSPLFDRHHEPIVPPVVLGADERQKLREHPRA